MEIRNLTCIGCPLGCALKVELEGNEIQQISGYTCKRGEDYARKEVTHPTRTVTSIVRVSGGEIAMVSVKTKQDIPKEKIMDIMEAIASLTVSAPVQAGDVILPDAAKTGVPIIATKDVAAKQ